MCSLRDANLTVLLNVQFETGKMFQIPLGKILVCKKWSLKKNPYIFYNEICIPKAFRLNLKNKKI